MGPQIQIGDRTFDALRPEEIRVRRKLTAYEDPSIGDNLASVPI